MTTLPLRTAAWYGDRELELPIPDGWDVRVLRPATPPPLTDADVFAALEHPVGRPPLRELARGVSRPVIVVDDLTRPSPAANVMPALLGELRQAGIAPSRVTVVIATGTHPPPASGAAEKKLGPEAAACRVVAHDCERGVVRVGRTSFGTPVLVNEHVHRADLLIGVSGIYPQHSTGFGGGSKLALGVLGKRSIIGLHYGHRSVGGSHDVRNDFRRDLDEIARMIGLLDIVSVQVGADRRIVRVRSGDHFAYHAEEAALAREAFRAPRPGDADVVIANAYPVDISVSFVR